MSKSIRSYPEHKRQDVVDRRLHANTGGLGCLAAKDYQAIMIERAKKKYQNAAKVEAQKEGVPA